MIQTNKKKISLLALLIGLVFFYFYKNNASKNLEHSKQNIVKKITDSTQQDLKSKTKKRIGLNHTHDHSHTDTNHTHQKKYSKPIDFSYQTESKKLLELIQNFPQSKSELLKVITTENPIKNPKPHSLSSLQQQQIGGLKVLALRSLYEKQRTQKTTLAKDLSYIAQSAKDPSLAAMAQDALSSLDSGRPFFKDRLDGIQNLPIPD